MNIHNPDWPIPPVGPEELARRMGLWGVDRLRRKTQTIYKDLHDSPLSDGLKLETFEKVICVYATWVLKTLPLSHRRSLLEKLRECALKSS